MSAPAPVPWWILVGFLGLLLIPSLLFVGVGIGELGSSNDDLTSQALDVYEGSAAFLYVTALIGLVGIPASIAVCHWAPVRSIARAGLAVAVLFVLSGAAQAAIHYILMRRVTELTGQGFGGFP